MNKTFIKLWFILPLYFFSKGLYDWFIFDDFKVNQFLGSFVLFLILYLYVKNNEASKSKDDDFDSQVKDN
tara:strand:+ start:944 stop:1153 length:210 start_codon:yes stop_codon:yes gene_type:complete